MRYFTELSLTAQTSYAQLADAALAANLARTVADLPGSFVPKTVRGKKYWYFQYTEPSSKLRQLYVGPDSESVQKLIQTRQEGHGFMESLSGLVRSAIALGCSPVISRHFKVINRLAEYGFFQAGGVLVGTHAFLAYGNMFGVAWGDSHRTQDVDFAHAGRSLELALPSDLKINTEDAIQSLEMGFLPVSGLSGKLGATYLIPKEPDFRLDFLTPQTRFPGEEEPYVHKKLNIPLQPLKFMEFSLENIQQAVMFSGNQAAVVHVPHPARFALHKLIVYGERSGTFVSKAGKDLLQAACLLSFLLEHREWEVEEAFEDLVGRGKGWTSRAKRGLDALKKLPEPPVLPLWLSL